MPVRKQDEISRTILRKRLDTVIPMAMRQAGLDMWLILCQEDDYDPIFRSMIPLRTWAPILQMLVFFDRGPEQGIERINLSMTDLGDLFTKPWKGFHHIEQWPFLAQLVAERDPQRIGINIGSVQWAAGGLTHNLYQQLCAALPAPYVERLVSAEEACTVWLETLVEEELQYYPSIVHLTHQIIQESFSPRALIPGVTTTDDLQWAFWEYTLELGLEQDDIPFFYLARSPARKQAFPLEDKIIRQGDMVRCDVVNRILRLHTDIQEWVYVRLPGEVDAPPGLKNLFTQVSRLQQIFMAEFTPGLTGNELLNRILARARTEGVPNPRVYSHSLGFYLHETGPLIGLPWEQQQNPGRGDVKLVPNTTFTMELSIETEVPEWNNQPVRFSCEEDVLFDGHTCRPMDQVQTAFYLS